MKNVVGYFIEFFFLTAFIACTTSPKNDKTTIKKDRQQPNILILMPDQFRADMMGIAGQPDVITPNIDHLAGDGIRFTNSISGAPVCCPTRATFQTGLYIHEHGVTNNNMLMAPEETTIAELLVEAGYATGFIGKWHLDGGIPEESVGGYIEKGPRRQGWQDWNGYEKSHEYFDVWKFNNKKQKVRVEGYNWEPTWQTDMALDFIQRKTDEKKPWCYYVAYGPPHNPYECPQEFLDMYDPNDIVLPPDVVNELSKDELKEVRRLRQIYYGQVSAIDREVGRLVDGLEKLNIDDNTIILFISDHGDVLGSHAHEIKEKYQENNKSLKFYLRTKGKPYITAMRTPLIVKWPAEIKAGQTNDVLVNSVDIAPTLLELAGIKVPEKMSGKSMAGWCLDDSGPDQKALYIGLFDGNDAWRGVWDGRYSYANLDYQVLYDHKTDPYEMNNLFDNPDYRALKVKMQEKLETMAKRTGDPLFGKIKDTNN